VSELEPTSEFQNLDVAERPVVPQREGLPSTYRMRSDAHYVDLLSSRSTGPREQQIDVNAIDAPDLADLGALGPLVDSVRRHGLLQPLLINSIDGRYRLIGGRKRLAAAVGAGLRRVPCVIHELNREEAEALAAADNLRPGQATAIDDALPAVTVDTNAELAQSLQTLTTYTQVLAGSTSQLSRAVASNLIAAEVWRASLLLHASRIIRRELPLTRVPLAPRRIVDHVAEGFAPERTLRNLDIEFNADSDRVTLDADESYLITGLSGALVASVALVDNIPGARLSLSAFTEDRNVVFEVLQNMVAPVDTWLARAFDATWVERPGGTSSAAGLLAAQSVADSHGGHADVSRTARGTRIRLVLPVAR
jgi:ParB/RepB/Spo0J family partition protein